MKNCCSDYHICKNVFYNSSKINNCKLSALNNEKCVQCNEGFFYFNNECLEECPENSQTIYQTKVCLQKYCLIDKCEACEKENSSCTKCIRGYYLYNGKCFNQCPKGMLADREFWACKQKNETAFYWVQPSRFSCKNKCSVNNHRWDCSCNQTCLQAGNCCQDYSNICGSQIKQEICKSCLNCGKGGVCSECKANSTLLNDKCECNDDLFYNNETDSCLKIENYKRKQKEDMNNYLNLSFSSNDNSTSKSEQLNNINYYKEGDKFQTTTKIEALNKTTYNNYQSINNSTTTNQTLTNENDFKHSFDFGDQLLKSLNLNVYFNEDYFKNDNNGISKDKIKKNGSSISINIFKGNNNLKIINQNIQNHNY